MSLVPRTEQRPANATLGAGLAGCVMAARSTAIAIFTISRSFLRKSRCKAR